MADKQEKRPFVVTIKEVWDRDIAVLALNEQDAMSRADRREGKEVNSEFQHTMGKEYWNVEERKHDLEPSQTLLAVMINDIDNLGGGRDTDVEPVTLHDTVNTVAFSTSRPKHNICKDFFIIGDKEPTDLHELYTELYKLIDSYGEDYPLQNFM